MRGPYNTNRSSSAAANLKVGKGDSRPTTPIQPPVVDFKPLLTALDKDMAAIHAKLDKLPSAESLTKAMESAVEISGEVSWGGHV